MQRTWLFVLFSCYVISACNQAQSNKEETKEQPGIYNFKNTDAPMNAAIARANQTLNLFDSALQSKNPGVKNFSIKVRYKTDKGYEHIWASDIETEGYGYAGVIADDPSEIKGLKINDHVHISKDSISDWMYIDNGKLRGGYTIRVIRNNMTPQEREQFDNEMKGITINDN